MHENRWLAGRFGVDALLIVEPGEGDDGPSRRPLRELTTELVERLEPIAVQVGCLPELRGVLDILEHGSGSVRQRRLVNEGATLNDVTHVLARELRDDRPTLS